jgi:hypothetical protein
MAINLTGKETKIYVAGWRPRRCGRAARTAIRWTARRRRHDPIFINTEAGPTGTVTSVKVGYSVDGGTTWQAVAMTATNWASTGGTWYFNRLGQYPASTVIKYYIEIEDAEGNKKWDNNDGQNYTLTVKAAAGVWVRNSKNYPVDGDVTEDTDLYLNTEAGPSGTVMNVQASYSTNGTTWTQTNLALKADWGSDGGNWYEVNLGTFAAGATVRYGITATDGTTTNVDDNSGAYYQVTVRAAESNALWVGDTGFQPANGEITAASVIQITTETWPAGTATNVVLVYTVDGGTTWQQQGFTEVGSSGANDIWQATRGPFADGTTLRFAVLAQADGQSSWDNNGGLDFRATVGEVGGLRMVEHTPVITTGGSPDNAGDQFDFDTTGGAATTSGTNGFGRLRQHLRELSTRRTCISAARAWPCRKTA